MEILKKSQKICPCCMEEHEVSVVLVQEKNVFKGVEVTYNATYEYCERCDEYNATEEMIRANDIALKNAYRNKVGLLTSDKIIAIRKKYAISQSDLCRLLAWGKKTITRYEGHQVQDAAHDKILRKIDSDPEWFLTLLEKAKNEFSKVAYNKYFQNALKLFENNKDLYLQKAVGSHYFCSENSNSYGSNASSSLAKPEFIRAADEKLKSDKEHYKGYKCIYSLKDESNATFDSSEHIFPKFLGGICTLDKGLVCDEVNQMFSPYEMLFARNNPLVVIPRMIYGPIGRLKHSKKDIVTFCQTQDNIIKLGYIIKGIPKIINQLHVSLSTFLNPKDTSKANSVQIKLYLEPDETIKNLETNSQSLLKQQCDMIIENFRTDIVDKCKQYKILRSPIMSKDCIIVGTWRKNFFIGAHESVSDDVIKEVIKRLCSILTNPNIFKEGKQLQPLISSSQTEFDVAMNFSIDVVYRIYGKIAFNCLTKIFGSKYVLQPCFDDFRKSIYLGRDIEKFVTLGIDNNQLDQYIKIFNLGKNCHIFLCLQIGSNMAGILYLYGKSVPVIITFSENSTLCDSPITYGYICDWEKHREMTLHEAMHKLVQTEHNKLINIIQKR